MSKGFPVPIDCRSDRCDHVGRRRRRSAVATERVLRAVGAGESGAVHAVGQHGDRPRENNGAGIHRRMLRWNYLNRNGTALLAM